MVLLSVTMVLPALALAKTNEHPAAERKEQAEQKGALKEHADPAKDREVQEANVKKLRQNAAAERKNGNRVGAWAAEHDAKHAEKLMAKDKALMQKGERKSNVDGRRVRP